MSDPSVTQPTPSNPALLPRDRLISALAETLLTVLAKLKSLLADPAYNLVLHQSPNLVCARRLWPEIERISHWYMEIIPVLTHVAGFEWGTGFYINPVAPESAAKFLRD